MTTVIPLSRKFSDKRVTEENSVDELTSSMQISTTRDTSSVGPNLVIDEELLNSEQSYKMRKVSGLDCIVQAQIRKGKIVGCLSIKTETKPFKFEFNPIQTGNF